MNCRWRIKPSSNKSGPETVVPPKSPALTSSSSLTSEKGNVNVSECDKYLQEQKWKIRGINKSGPETGRDQSPTLTTMKQR
jgi:hypothetical protein